MVENPTVWPSFKDVVIGLQAVNGFHEIDDLGPLTANDGLIHGKC